MSEAASTFGHVGDVLNYHVLREGGVGATLAGTDGREGYVRADVFVRRDVKQITVGSETHLGEKASSLIPCEEGRRA